MPDAAEDVRVARYKQQAAERAVDLVRSGMLVGLGTGSTAVYAVRRIGALLRSGELVDVTGVPTSRVSEDEARAAGVPLRNHELEREVDLTIDGADEVDPALDLIKGRGGALLRERIVAQASRREVIVVDEGKLSRCLGTRSPVPVEVLPFGWRSQMRYLESLGARVEPRAAADGGPQLSDQGNLILLCRFAPIAAPAELAGYLSFRGGIVAHGLFLGLATDLIVAGPSGIDHRTRA